MEYRTRIKLTEGWLDLKYPYLNEGKWTTVWCVLKDCTMFIFKNKITRKENNIYRLDIDPSIRFKCRDTNIKKGVFKFDISVTNQNIKFKTSRFSDRELWKAFIIGLAQGDVPHDVDLPASQIQEVQYAVNEVFDDLRKFHQRQINKCADSNSGDSAGSASSAGSQFSSHSGRVSKHKFWNDPDRNDIPSWFFANITRERAETILSDERHECNTLMRESVSHPGSYVITQKTKSEQEPFCHYKVKSVAYGFEVNIMNQVQIIKCLSDVMDLFVEMTGCDTTRPMTTNNLETLCMEMSPCDIYIDSWTTVGKKTESDQVAAAVQESETALTHPTLQPTLSMKEESTTSLQQQINNIQLRPVKKAGVPAEGVHSEGAGILEKVTSPLESNKETTHTSPALERQYPDRHYDSPVDGYNPVNPGTEKYTSLEPLETVSDPLAYKLDTTCNKPSEEASPYSYNNYIVKHGTDFQEDEHSADQDILEKETVPLSGNEIAQESSLETVSWRFSLSQ